MPPLGSSDHHAVLIKPRYQTQHKLRKHSIKGRKLWTNESIDQIKTDFAITNWDLFADGSVDQAAELTIENLCYLIETNIPTKSIKVYANNRPCCFIRNELEMPAIPPKAILQEFEYQEVLKALNNCKPGKAAGPDSIPTKVLN